MGLERFSELFAENFDESGELGASVCIRRNGEEILHLAGGYLNRDRRLHWTKETPVLIWSATKGLSSACLVHAASEHRIALDRRIVDLWPEYGENGKEETTLLHVLTHQAGQPALRDSSLSMLDHDAVASQLARQQPFWKPGSTHGYHPRTYGFLVDELVRRITHGIPLSTYFRLVFGDPLNLNLWIGVPESLVNDVATIYAPRESSTRESEKPFYQAFVNRDSLTRTAFATPAGLFSPSQMNDPKVRRHSLPSLGGIGTAGALARFYQILCSDEIFSWETIHRIAAMQCMGKDQILQIDTAFGIGFMKDPLVGNTKTRKIFGPEPDGFGQPGSGGSLGFCDPKNGIAFAYVMNQMEPGIFPNAKSLRLVDYLYERPGEIR
ncbi:MAG: beta-lactamase family protein [Verrucomicrobia bacterium]|nr:beta-lactamase family protein [Verrucomicrobiota bacterium]